MKTFELDFLQRVFSEVEIRCRFVSSSKIRCPPATDRRRAPQIQIAFRNFPPAAWFSTHHKYHEVRQRILCFVYSSTCNLPRFFPMEVSWPASPEHHRHCGTLKNDSWHRACWFWNISKDELERISLHGVRSVYRFQFFVAGHGMNLLMGRDRKPAQSCGTKSIYTVVPL